MAVKKEFNDFGGKIIRGVEPGSWAVAVTRRDRWNREYLFHVAVFYRRWVNGRSMGYHHARSYLARVKKTGEIETLRSYVYSQNGFAVPGTVWPPRPNTMTVLWGEPDSWRPNK